MLLFFCQIQEKCTVKLDLQRKIYILSCTMMDNTNLMAERRVVMSVTSISSLNSYYQLQQTQQTESQQQSQDSTLDIGEAATLELSSSSSTSNAVSGASSGSQSGSITNSSQCPQGKSSCISCGQCGKTTSSQNNTTNPLVANGAMNTANYQLLRAINAYESL